MEDISLSTREAVPHRRADVAILTALPEEFAEVQGVLRLLRASEVTLGTRRYVIGRFPGVNGELTCAITLLGSMGNVDSAVAASDILRDLDPAVLIVVGIAGGVPGPDRKLGDVVVADAVFYYEPEKLAGQKRQLRPQRLKLSGDALQSAKMLLAARRDVHFGPIAAGEQVIASSARTRSLLKLEPKLEAIEMESWGVACAIAASLARTQLLVFRGVSDFADESKGDDWHVAAARAAAVVTGEYLAQCPLEPAAVSPEQNSQNDKHPDAGLEAAPAEAYVLYKRIHDSLDMVEFKLFCSFAGVDADDFAGADKREKALELVRRFVRRGRQPELEALLGGFLSEL